MTFHVQVKIKKAHWLVILLSVHALMAFSSCPVVFDDQAQVGTTSDTLKYRCPPCGCNFDDSTFGTSGDCPHCGMPLVELPEGLGESVDAKIAPLLKIGHLGKIYTKLIYPVFAVGILLSTFFLFRRFKGGSLNIFLAGLILVLSLYGFKNQLFAASYSLFTSHKSLFIPISFILLIGPLIYLYTKDLTQNSFSWNRKYWVFFIPAALMFVYYAVLLVVPVETSWRFIFNRYEVRFSHSEQSIAVVGALISVLYAHRLVREMKLKTMRDTLVRSWLLRFLGGMTVLLLVWGLLIFANFWLYDFGVSTLGYNPLWILSSMTILWLLLEIMARPSLFLLPALGADQGLNSTSAHSLDDGAKYSKSGLKEEESEKLLRQLTEFMSSSKAYLDSTITLDKVSSETKIYKHHISQAINKNAGMNFYAFINEFRIQCAIEKLKLIYKENKTIEAISFECGFSSKSTFNNLFKKKFGITPSQYLQEPGNSLKKGV